MTMLNLLTNLPIWVYVHIYIYVYAHANLNGKPVLDTNITIHCRLSTTHILTPMFSNLLYKLMVTPTPMNYRPSFCIVNTV